MIVFSNGTAKKEYEPEYTLVPTSNMWTFIKLDTINGRMWQVQYSVQGDDYRFQTGLNFASLVEDGEEFVGRLDLLYIRHRIQFFVLLDQHIGRVWQVQWSQEYSNRMILEIR
ncbi:MAG: hypothetical protein GX664_09005 [Bacteroidales bacterium]|nr:hypothetical protein [Bacteroidales bacterium]